MVSHLSDEKGFDMAPRNFEVVSRKIRYQSEWLTLKECEILRDGSPGTYDVVERPNSVTILVLTTNDQLLLLNQFRFPTGSNSWELPMGGIDDGESPHQAAQRELREETGIERPLQQVGSFHPIPGLTPQSVTVYRARIPEGKVAQIQSFGKPVDEIVERRFLPFQEIRRMISSSEISDGFTLSSIAIGFASASESDAK